MTGKKDEDAGEPKGLFAGWGQRLKGALMEPSESDASDDDGALQAPSAVPAQAHLTPASPAFGGTDPRVVESAKAHLTEALNAKSEIGALFLATYESLAEAIADPRARAIAALKVLRKQRQTTSAEVKLGFGQMRQRLGEIAQEAEARFSADMQVLEVQRRDIESRYRKQHDELTATVARLRQELEAAQAQLSALPARQQAEIASVLPGIQQGHIKHASVKSALDDVLGWLNQLDALITE